MSSTEPGTRASSRSSSRLSALSSEIKRPKSMSNLLSIRPREANNSAHPSPRTSSRRHIYASDGDTRANSEEDEEEEDDEDDNDDEEGEEFSDPLDDIQSTSSRRASSGRTSRQSTQNKNNSHKNQTTVAPDSFYAKDPSISIGGRTLRNRQTIKAPDRTLDQQEAASEYKRAARRRKSKRELRDEARSRRFEDRYAHLGKREFHGRSVKGAVKYTESDGSSLEEESEDYDEDDSSEEEEDMSFMSNDSARSNRNRNNNNNYNNKAKTAALLREEKENMKRAAMRAELTKESTRRRNNFLLAKRQLFEPLLGEKNYISKLDQNASDSQDELSIIGDEKPPASPKSTSASIIPYKELEKQPEEIQATLKPYQLKGLSFLVYLFNNGLSGILGDEMGLGKTLQTLSLFSYVSSNFPPQGNHSHRPFLVICPLSVLTSWVNEAKRFTPHLKAMRLHGPVRERERLKRMCQEGLETGKDGVEVPVHPDDPKRGWDIVVTTYETFVAEKVWFRRAFMWRYAVLDEGHAIKNSESIVSKTLNSIGAEYRLILTGTPLQNDLFELWSLFHWLYPDVFTVNTADMWRTAFNLTKGQVDTQFVTNSRKLLEVFMLRRMKNSPSVNLGLPEKEEVVLFVPLSPMQRAWYKSILTKLDESTLTEIFSNSKDKEASDLKNDIIEKKRLEGVEAKVNGGTSDEIEDQWKETEEMVKKSLQQAKNEPIWKKLMNLLMQLRKVCNHPYLMPHAEPDPYYLGQHIILASSKFILLEKLIKQLVLTEDRKVLIFSGFTKTLDLCEDFLNLVGGDGEKFRYCRLDGSTSRGRRNLSIRLFNKPGSEYKVFLISTKAGGLGINLTSATEVVMMDASWNPQVDLQAEARSHRIGQTKKVTVYRIMTQGTVEEQMIGRIQKKLYLSAKVTESMREVHADGDGPSEKLAEEDEGPQMSTNQLMSLVRRGAQAIAAPEVDPKEMLSWDWQRMIKECKDYQRSSNEQQAAAESKAEEQKHTDEQEHNWLNSVEKVETRIFEGKRMQKEAAKASKLLSLDRSDRRQGKNRTVTIDGYEVLKETVGNADWEAVATFAGKDPRLRDPPKRKKAKINHQDYCQVCLDGGEIVMCSGCPRSYHIACMSPEMQKRSMSGNFYCTQHECHDCEQKSSDVGNLIYRCRWCEKGYCEDCLNFEETELVGDSMLEYDLLDYGAIPQAYYVSCPACTELTATNSVFKKMCNDLLAEWEKQREEREAAELKAEEEAAESLTDATTLISSGALTPANPTDKDPEVMIIDDPNTASAGKGSARKGKGQKGKKVLTNPVDENGFAKLNKVAVEAEMKRSKQKTLDSFFGSKTPKAVVVPIMTPSPRKSGGGSVDLTKDKQHFMKVLKRKSEAISEVIDLVDTEGPASDVNRKGGMTKRQRMSARKSIA